MADCIRSRSDSDPTRMPTSGPSAIGGDVRPEVHAGEIYASGRLVGSASCGLGRRADADDVQDPAAVRDEPTVVEGGAGMEDERAGRLCVLDALDRSAAVGALGVLAARDHDGDGGGIRDLGLLGEVAGEERQEVALEAGEER